MTATVWTDGHFIGGHPALDFCNTVYRRLPEVGAELLDSPETYSRWLERVLLVPEGYAIDQSTLEQSIKLRSDLWLAFDSQINGETIKPEVLSNILQYANHGAGVRIDASGEAEPLNPAAVPSAIALLALQIILCPPSPPVRACYSCGWYFIDTSRGRRRRWCSMKTCGNQYKVAQFRASQ